MRYFGIQCFGHLIDSPVHYSPHCVEDDYCVAIHDLSPVLTALFSFELGGFNKHNTYLLTESHNAVRLCGQKCHSNCKTNYLVQKLQRDKRNVARGVEMIKSFLIHDSRMDGLNMQASTLNQLNCVITSYTHKCRE